ncbi:MAG: metal ABC transporter substrate-binding protein, partial [Candidatus Njordarchaeota archaeon]
MKRKIMLIIGILMVTSTLLVANAKISAQEEKPVVVTTTSVIASVVEDLAGDSVKASYLVPPSLCPGHYDIRPSDVDLISKADLILKHGIMGEYWLSDLIDSANESGTLSVPVVSVGTSWNTPGATRDIYTNVANALEQYLDLEVENRLSKCLEAINVTESTLKDIASQYGFNNTPVVVMLWQKTFVEYLGFKVVATYGPPDKISEQDIVEVEENATKEGAI